jgi:Aminoglycoside-2''-adenylyltransferase
MPPSAGGNERQLRLLREIVCVLREEAIPFWLRGGWALDFLRGQTGRPHSDLDLVACAGSRRPIEDLLRSRAYVSRALAIPQAQISFTKLGEEVSFVLVEKDSAGQVLTPGFELWPWPAGAFDGPVRTLDGLTCRIIAPEALLEEKENYQRHVGRELREKDHESIRALRELVAAQPAASAAAASATGHGVCPATQSGQSHMRQTTRTSDGSCRA